MPSSEDAIVISKDVKALTVHLVGYNKIGSSDHYAFNLKGNTALTFTTSETMPGTICTYGQVLYSEQLALATYQNGLALNTENNEITAETGDMNIASFTGFVSYVNSDNGGSAYIYSKGSEFEATVAELKNKYVLVSTPANSTQTEMWTTSIDVNALEKFTFQFDWGTCTNKNVKVQAVGYSQNKQTYDWVADGKTYSSEISLSTADADGIVEIPLTSAVTSEEVRLKFTSTGAFSFVPLNIGITQTATYPITIAETSVTAKNAEDVLGDGTVSFDAETNTLTLNGATINGRIFCDQLGDNGLTVHLLGSNVIDGGYQSTDYNGDYAFVTEGESVPLTFTTDEKKPGQLLMKNTFRDEYGYPEYYSGFISYPTMENGLSYTSADKKRLIAVAPVMTPGEGLYWTDQQYEISGLAGAAIYYQDYLGMFSQTAYEAPFSLTTVRKYNLGIWEEMTVDGSSFSLSANSGSHYIVHNKPGFSVEAGAYTGTQNITLTNLPSSLPTGDYDYPQVWYYLGENQNDSVRITSVEQKIALTESTRVCVYILDEDSGKVYKSENVEAEYTILQSPELHFWTSEYSYIGTGNSYGTLDYYELESFTSPTLKAKIDGNYTSELADFGITYSSSDNAIATIDATGKITFAGGAGVVTIKAVSQETDVYAADSTWFTITLRPSDPQASIESGAYFVGQKVTMIPTVSNGEMYYKIGWDGEKVKYTEPITLPKGITEISFYTLCSTKDGEMWSYGNNHPTYYVYDKLTFTPDSGTVSNDDIVVEIGNLPEANDYYPATVYYYFDDDEDNAKEYSSTTKVTVPESSTLKTFIEVRGDSGNVYRSEPVEAEYTVLPKTELNISYAQNSREWASYCAEADLETPEGLQAYVVSGITEDGVSVSEISYIPQGEGILLKRIAENVTEPIMAKAYMNDGPQQEMPVNWLLGTAASKTISTGSSDIFVLYNDGFTRAYKGSIPAHRAYLVITQSAPVSSRLSIFEDGEPTSVIENREWRMENSGTSWYTLDGRKLQAEPTKAGVYIQKGQKKVVK